MSDLVENPKDRFSHDQAHDLCIYSLRSMVRTGQEVRTTSEWMVLPMLRTEKLPRISSMMKKTTGTLSNSCVESILTKSHDGQKQIVK